MSDTNPYKADLLMRVHDKHGTYVQVAEDPDELGLVEVSFVVDKQVQESFTMTVEQARVVAEAIGVVADHVESRKA